MAAVRTNFTFAAGHVQALQPWNTAGSGPNLWRTQGSSNSTPDALKDGLNWATTYLTK